jgi:hypothetical protein
MIAANIASTAGDIRARAGELMYPDGAELIEQFRDCHGWAETFDLVKVAVVVPQIQDGNIEAGEFGNEVFVRELSGPRGLIEALIVELERVCEPLDEFRYQPPAEAETATAPTAAGQSPADAVADDASGAPAEPERGAVVNESAGEAIEESAAASDDDAEFGQRIERSAGYQFTGREVAPLNLMLTLPGGDELLDVPLLVVPADRHALLGELREVAARWAGWYVEAVQQGRIG